MACNATLVKKVTKVIPVKKAPTVKPHILEKTATGGLEIPTPAFPPRARKARLVLLAKKETRVTKANKDLKVTLVPPASKAKKETKAILARKAIKAKPVLLAKKEIKEIQAKLAKTARTV